MSCNSSSTHGPISVWSNLTQNSWVFFPMSGILSTTGVDSIRTALELRSATSGNAKIRPSLRCTNDGASWDSPVAIGSLVQTGSGASYDSDYNDMSTTLKAKAYFQLGVECATAVASPTFPELGLATVRFDRRSS